MVISRDRAYIISLLQENLQILREIAGWTTDDLSKKIGVSKQTISDLEDGNTKMSLTQYIALRVVFDYAVQEYPENKTLPQAMYILLDAWEQLADAEYVKLQEALAVAKEADESGIAEIFAEAMKNVKPAVTREKLAFKNDSRARVASPWVKALLEQE